MNFYVFRLTMLLATLLTSFAAFGDDPINEDALPTSISTVFESTLQIQFLAQDIDRLERSQRASQTAAGQQQLKALRVEMGRLKASNPNNSGFQNPQDAFLSEGNGLQPHRGRFTKRWRDHYQIVNLKNEYFSVLENGDREMRVYYDRSEAKDFHVLFKSQFVSGVKKETASHGDVTVTHKPLSASLVCDKTVKIKTSLFPYKTIKGGKKKNLRIFYSSEDAARFKIKIKTAGTQCALSWTHKKNAYKVLLSDEAVELPDQEKFKSQVEVCPLPGQWSTPLEKVFFTPNYQNMGCAFNLSSHQVLSEKIDGLQAKAKALLGQELPEDMLLNTDPYYPLDFSKAPNLSGIFISYLVWRSDFSGTIINRLVRHHAAKGVPIKIMISKVISLKKDKATLRKLNADFPNVQVKLYKYNESQVPTFRDAIGQVHRTNHIKAFIVKYQAEDAENDTVIVGGRNIHDGFMFDKTPDISRFPELVQYGDDEGKALWTDFEILLREPKWVSSVISQFYSAWNYDRDRYIFRGFSYPVVDPNASASQWLDKAGPSGLVRHFTSAPYSDDMSLERLYVDLIDAAEKKIHLSTPYFNLTSKIAKAFKRAVDRGVEVDVITRLNLDGDTAGSLLADVNKGQVNSFRKEVSISAFSLPTNVRDILHSKLIVIDDKLTVVGSINFNQRSFYHDLENCSLIWSPKITKEISDLLAKYRAVSQPVEIKQKIAWYNKIIIWVIKKEL